MYNNIVAIDLDGVIWDLVTPWINKYNIYYNDNIKYDDVLEYRLSNTLVKATQKELCDILLEPGFWDSVKPFKNSYEYLNKMNEEFKIYIATKTHYKIFSTKVERLLSLFPFLNEEQIICIYDKELLEVDWLVDDCADNLYYGSYNKIILDAPYNRDYTEFIRAKDLKEVYNIIKYGDNLND
jgi:5'(3')-deoxyribonucleotidase